MKCPYRIVEIEKRNKDLTESAKHEFYEECYGILCPFYDRNINKCLRVIKELQ